MNKTEAAKEMALQVTVFACKYQQAISTDAVLEHMSECAVGHRGPHLAQAAKVANRRTVLKLSNEMLRQQGDYALITFQRF